jgi:hypothetical protein
LQNDENVSDSFHDGYLLIKIRFHSFTQIKNQPGLPQNQSPAKAGRQENNERCHSWRPMAAFRKRSRHFSEIQFGNSTLLFRRERFPTHDGGNQRDALALRAGDARRGLPLACRVIPGLLHKNLVALRFRRAHRAPLQQKEPGHFKRRHDEHCSNSI